MLQGETSRSAVFTFVVINALYVEDLSSIGLNQSKQLLHQSRGHIEGVSSVGVSQRQGGLLKAFLGAPW